ncbi:MAG: ketoacyl-ACP synthase III, partial [Spirochaetales bacterium]|nr:ketoacyl-ACP synthase III [Spirochaetales bacterium]
FVPDTVVENSYFESLFNLPPGDISRKTGLESRHHADSGTAPTDIGIIAARGALEAAAITPAEIDMIISAGTSRDQSIPPDSMLYANKLSIPSVQCVHIEAVCLSFLNAMEIANLYIQDGRKQKILIISSEITSRVIDNEDPSSSFLLGDGAAAAIVTPSEDNSRIVASHFRTEALGENIGVASVEGGGIRNLPTDSHYHDKMTTFHVKGPLELKLAIKFIPAFLGELLAKADCTLDDIDHVIPHQVVPKMITSILSHLGIASDKLLINTKHGNMAAASIPVLFADAVANGIIKRGERVMLFGGAAGFSLGGIILDF